MTTIVVGDVDSTKAIEAIKSKFNRPVQVEDKKKTISYKFDKKPTTQTEKTVEMDLETGYILIGYKGCYPIDVKDSYALDVLAIILGDGKSSRLYKNIKEQKQLVHSIASTHSSMKDDSIFYISANYSTEDIARLKEAIFAEVENLKKNDISEEEIQKAKNIIERDTFYARESVSNIAQEIGYTVTITDSLSYYEKYLDNINKVTAEDLKRVAKEYLDKENAVISIVSPKKTEKQAIKQQEKKDYSAKVISTNDNTTKYELENGATLIITQNTTNDIVALEMSSRGGNNLEKTPGIASLTAATMMKGTDKYKSQELSLILEENGIRLNTSAGSDSFRIAAKYTKNQEALIFDLFEQVSKKASLDTYEFEKVKTDKLFAIKSQRNNPDAFVFDEFKTIMWENTPYGNTGKILEKTIPSIQREDIAEFYKNIFDAQNVVITLNGNVNAQDYINFFSKLLEKTNTPKVKLSTFKNRFKNITLTKGIKIEKDTQASWLLYGWLTDGSTNEKDWATLQVINAILGSGMSSRLFTNLRDEESLAYQVGSSFSAKTNKGSFVLYIATNPNSTVQAKESMFREIKKLQKEFVTDKELSEAKDKLLGNFVLSMETNMEKASLLNSLEITEKGYDFVDKYPDLIKSVTIQDVINVANKYFSKPYIYTVLGKKESIEKL